MIHPRAIKTKIDRPKNDPAVLGGWLQGRSTYLWLGYKDKEGVEHFIGTLGKRKLYVLARAIVRQFESDEQ